MGKHHKGLIIILSGFSGAGKGTIMKHLLRKYPSDYHLSVSATTRAKRQGEEDGREYFFKSREQFEEMIADGALLEYACFNGNYYGTPKSYVEQTAAQGCDIILEIEIQGALQVKKIYPDALLLFVMPPDAATLEARLTGRGTETADVVAQRLAIAAAEASYMEKYDYLVVNDDLERAVEEVHHMIQSEHFRIDRNAERICAMQQDLKRYERRKEQ